MTAKKQHLLRSFTDRMIPERYMQADYDTRRRARIVVNFTYAMSCFGPLYGLIYWLRYDLPIMAIIITGLAIHCALSSTFLIKKTKTLVIPSINSLMHLYMVLLVIITFVGGIDSSTFVWFPIFPAVSIMFLGSLGGYAWTGLAIATSVVYFILHKFGVALPSGFPSEYRPITMVTSVAGASLFMMIVANLYESTKNYMLEEGRSSKAEAEFHRVKAEEAHKRAKMVLDAVDQGFVMIDGDGTLNEEYSAALERIVDTPENNIKVWDFFRPKSTEIADWMEMTWSQLEMKTLPASLILNQIPPMFRLGENVYLSVQCQTIHDSDKFLMVVTDISEKIAAERAQESHREIISIVGKAASYGSVFQESIDELEEIVAKLTDCLNSKNTEKSLLHTLKGSSAVCGMISIPRIVHDLETKRENSNAALDAEDLAMLKSKWNQLMEKITPFLKAKNDLKIEVSMDDYDGVIKSIRQNATPDKILAQLDSWLREPTQKRLLQAAEHAKVMANKLEKPSLTVQVLDNGIRLDGEQWRGFWSVFAHVVRNAVDHGIEDADVRVNLGKPPGGKLELSSSIVKGELVVRIKDDGAGIDWNKVRAAAHENGLKVETTQHLVAALFHNGLSTKNQVSTISGRGVGMSAVKDACEALGGIIEINSTQGQGTEIDFRFPLDAKSVYAA